MTLIPAGRPIIVGVSNEPADSVKQSRNAEKMLGAMRGMETRRSVFSTPEPDALLASSSDESMLRMEAEMVRYATGVRAIALANISPGQL
jgi:hypothetical protein